MSNIIEIIEGSQGLMKGCSRCGEVLPIAQFHKQQSMKTGLRSCCKDCRKKYEKTCCRINSKYKRGSRKNYYRLNRNKILKQQKEYYQTVKKIKNEKERLRKLSDPKFRLSSVMSTGISHSLKSGVKGGRRWESLVGYNANKLMCHLEKQFKDGMTWGNYGEWHVDHIIPISVFNYTKTEHEDFKRCWSLKNLQPMWAKENIEKSDNIEKHFQPKLKLAIREV